MSGGEWKPGDVAMLEVGCWANRLVGLHVGDGWRTQDGSVPNDPAIVTARPLAVIDPEDREQVERLVKALTDAWPKVITGLVPGDQKALDLIYTTATRAALREFADPNPPKPEEPTGLGAVVEDEDGNLWVCIRQGGTTNWRQCQGENRGRYWPYGQIPVVRVLSDGVRAGESA